MRRTALDRLRCSLHRSPCIGCGGGGAPEQAEDPAPTTVAASEGRRPPPRPPPATGEASDDEYELDVIAEAEPDEGAPPLKVQFTASVEEEEGGPWTFAWDFGDGGKSTEQNPLHTYDKVGEYTATLTRDRSEGQQGHRRDRHLRRDRRRRRRRRQRVAAHGHARFDLLLGPLQLAERRRHRRRRRAAAIAARAQAARQLGGA